MSENESESRPTDASEGSEGAGEAVGISDEQLPDDLVPGEDNPLAEGLEDQETVEGLLDGGKTAHEMESDDDSDGHDAP